MQSLKKILSALAPLALALLAPVHAEEMFVIDKVVLNVYAEPNQDSGKVATLETGDAVEAIDQLDPYIRVRLPDGREGWVRANYLSKQAPAVIRLKELQSGQPAAPQNPSPQVVQEIAELKKQNALLQGEATRLREQAAAKPVPAAAPVEVAKAVPVKEAAPAKETAPVLPAAVEQPVVRMWAWVAAIAAGGTLGFFLGYQALAMRIRRKYGNIKIY